MDQVNHSASPGADNHAPSRKKEKNEYAERPDVKLQYMDSEKNKWLEFSAINPPEDEYERRYEEKEREHIQRQEEQEHRAYRLEALKIAASQMQYTSAQLENLTDDAEKLLNWIYKK